MKKNIYAFLITTVMSYSAIAQNANNNYLQYVQHFANTLLEKGIDNYGPEKTPMWAGVMDTRNLSVPIRNVPPTKGVRPHDRAVGGANYYHDVLTLSVFDMLSKVTNDPKYEDAASAYSKAFLERTQNPETGLLGWGEHLYYHFYTDTVSIAESRILDQRGYFLMPHELIAWTPPWARLWEENPERVKQAIDGLQYHFNGPDPQTYLFNRHAIWNKTEYQQVIMPWIKHAALYAYSYGFLYKHTGDEQWKEKSRQTGILYWKLRDYRTDLVFGCFYHSSEPDAGKSADLSNTLLYAYWLYKAGELCASDDMKSFAITLLEAYDKYGWSEAEKMYYNELNLDGSLPENPQWATPWKIGYGSSSLLALARVTSYIAGREQSSSMTRMAERAMSVANQQPLLDIFTAQNIGEAINANLDVYELTQNQEYIDQAVRYADTAIEHLWKNGLFVRQKDDPYYEAKLGTGDLLSGLLRLHLILNNKQPAEDFDWSF